MALTADGQIAQLRGHWAYSVGGGFVLTEAELADQAAERRSDAAAQVPHPFANAAEMLAMAARSGKSIAAMKLENERSRRSDAEIAADAGDREGEA